MTRFSKIFPTLGIIVLSFLLIPSSSLPQAFETWTYTGLYGGQIYDIAIDPSNPQKAFAGSYLQGGLYVTTNAGNDWQVVEASNDPPGEGTFTNHAVWDVEIAPSDSSVIWVAHNHWVEKSTDGGETWSHILNSVMQRECTNCGGEDDNFRLCKSVAIDPADPNTVYVGTAGPMNRYLSGATYRTEDGGQTWTKLNQGDDFDYSVEDVTIDPQDSNVIWVVTNSWGVDGWNGTLYRGEIDLDEWVSVFTTPGGGFRQVEVKPDDSNLLFTGNDYGLFKHYYEKGEWKYEWILNHSNYPAWPPPEGEIWARWVWAITFDPQNPGVLYAAWRNVWAEDTRPKLMKGMPPYENSDWEIYTVDNHFQALAVHPVNSQVLFGGELVRGVYKSRDGGKNWTPINNGLDALLVYDVAADPNDSGHLIAATSAGVCEKQGDEWKLTSYEWTVGGTLVKSVAFDPTDSDGSTYFAGMYSYLAKTSNSGQDWVFAPVGSIDAVREIAIDPVQSDTLLIAVGQEICRSTDGGEHFDKVLEGVSLDGHPYAFNTVVIDPSNGQHIFAGGGNFNAPRVVGDLWESRNGGDTWTRTGLQNVIVNALLVDPRDPDTVYAGCGYSFGTHDPVYKSTDGGATWAPSHNGIPGSNPLRGISGTSATDLEFHPQNKDVIYASTLRQGVYVSSDQAGNWLNLGTPKYPVYTILNSFPRTNTQEVLLQNEEAGGLIANDTTDEHLKLYAGTQGGLLQCTGTGVIAGDVIDRITNEGIEHAIVLSDLGVTTKCIDGKYLMITPSGNTQITAVADGHVNRTIRNVTVYGGDITWVDIYMKSGLPDPNLQPGANDLTSSDGGGYCFVASAAYSSPLAKQVRVLRRFRDLYLLRHTSGQKLVDLYYRTGGFAGKYIEAHPGLKLVVRILLYPIIGITWLIVSTSPLVAVLIGLSLIICLLGATRAFRTIRSTGL